MSILSAVTKALFPDKYREVLHVKKDDYENSDLFEAVRKEWPFILYAKYAIQRPAPAASKTGKTTAVAPPVVPLVLPPVPAFTVKSGDTLPDIAAAAVTVDHLNARAHVLPGSVAAEVIQLGTAAATAPTLAPPPPPGVPVTIVKRGDPVEYELVFLPPKQRDLAPSPAIPLSTGSITPTNVGQDSGRRGSSTSVVSATDSGRASVSRDTMNGAGGLQHSLALSSTEQLQIAGASHDAVETESVGSSHGTTVANASSGIGTDSTVATASPLQKVVPKKPPPKPKPEKVFSIARHTDVQRVLEELNILLPVLEPFFSVVIQRQDQEIITIFNNSEAIKLLCEFVRANPKFTCVHVAAKFNWHKLLNHQLFKPFVNDASNDQKISPLALAIEASNEESVKALLDMPEIDLNQLDKNGNTLYHYAARSSKKIISLFSGKENTYLNLANEDGVTPLFEAAATNKQPNVLAVVELGGKFSLSQIEPPEAVGKYYKANKEAAKNLHKLFPDRFDASRVKFGGNPLHWARNKEAIEYFIGLGGSSVSGTTELGETPLHLQCMGNDIACVIALIINGADVNARDKQNDTALHLAVTYSSISIVECLVVFEARADLPNGHYLTPIDVANACRDPLRRKKLLRALCCAKGRQSNLRLLQPVLNEINDEFSCWSGVERQQASDERTDEDVQVNRDPNAQPEEKIAESENAPQQPDSAAAEVTEKMDASTDEATVPGIHKPLRSSMKKDTASSVAAAKPNDTDVKDTGEQGGNKISDGHERENYRETNIEIIDRKRLNKIVPRTLTKKAEAQFTRAFSTVKSFISSYSMEASGGHHGSSSADDSDTAASPHAVITTDDEAGSDADSVLPLSPAKNKGKVKKDRLLCLDGGGIRGLVLVKQLMAMQDKLDRPVIEYFDWVAGTSTGGILALAMSLGKSLHYCLCLYIRLKNEIFRGGRPYSNERFEAIIREEIGGNDLMMTDIPRPKLLISACLADRYPPGFHFFRNFHHPRAPELGLIVRHPVATANVAADTSANVTPGSTNVSFVADTSGSKIALSEHEKQLHRPLKPEEQPVWMAARATGAAPTFFRSAGIYLDGGLMANNPTLDALSEIHDYIFETCAIKEKEKVEVEEKAAAVAIRNNNKTSLAAIKAESSERRSSVSFSPATKFKEEGKRSPKHKGKKSAMKATTTSDKKPEVEKKPSATQTDDVKANAVVGAVSTKPKTDAENKQPDDEIDRSRPEGDENYVLGGLATNMGVVVSLGCGRVPLEFVESCDIYRPESMWDLPKIVFGISSFGRLIIEQAAGSEGRPVVRSRAWCESLGIPFYRFSPQLSEEILIDCTVDETLVRLMWETQAYLVAHDDVVSELCEILRNER